MASIKLICTSPVGGSEMVEVDCVRIIEDQGIEGDRYCATDTDSWRQITLIESEVIDQFNRETGYYFPYKMFRRNLITEGVRLNDLVGRIFSLGEVQVHGRELCEPCRTLQQHFKVDDLVRRLTHKGGLCCEILTTGIVGVGDEVKI